MKERLEFLKGPGGLRAAAYFGLKLLTRIDVFRIVWIFAQSSKPLMLPSGWRYLSLYTGEALSNLSSDIIERAADQCGSNPKQLLGRGGSLHLLLAGDSLVAQLSIERGPTCRIDSPPLYLRMAETDAFLSYLYTWPEYRRQGAAQRLIAATVSDLSTRNVHRIIAHIRATNVPSLAAFEHTDWKTGAMMICTLRGRLLMAPGATSAGLTFRSAI
ncbi:FR47-like protein [Nitrosospira multiformis]|uniref:FR47-like protein n=1 Tax=Nitrosospira multiformis TaxID=1231 RepID=A0A2T5IG49_9PROT|nr:GNAT family N-acetyltransferase [Nitrosospira multiformis]PTQ82803.1 FR47-like protein [Nitrosospira multiformis]